MPVEPLGITFRETMSGAFALGVRDPEEGRRRGERAGTELRLHVSVAIRDLRQFMADPDHGGSLTGHIAFAPFGRPVPGRAGAFRLSPGGEPGLQLMVYELGFEHLGELYCLTARKLVRNEAGFDLWNDRTTLLAELHEGADARGPVVGAGVLRLDMAELMTIVSTMRAIGGGSASDRATALAEFGRLFMGSLWSTYGRPELGVIRAPSAP